jgi:hypothetical protein
MPLLRRAPEFNESSRKIFPPDASQTAAGAPVGRVEAGSQNGSRFFALVLAHFSQVFTRKTSENLYRTAR